MYVKNRSEMMNGCRKKFVLNCYSEVDLSQDKYYASLSPPKIFIIFDESNELQSEMAEIVYNKLLNNYGDKIKIEKTNTHSLYTPDKNSNEPIIFIQNNLTGDTINPHSLNKSTTDFTVLNYKIKQKLNNLLYFKRVNSLTELRDEFRYIDNPRNNIIIIKESEVKDKSEIISLYRHKHTKIITVSDTDLIDYLKLKDDHMYIYHSSKLPNKMKDTDSVLKEYFNTNSNNISDILSKEGIDLNNFSSSNSISLMLRFGLYRDEIKLSKELFTKYILSGDNTPSIVTSQSEKIKRQKLVSYPQRRVSKLAETDRKIIKSQWDKENKHYLYLHIPNWAYLKESIFEYILYEASHLFDGIQVSDSINFSYKHSLYDDTGLSGELPQIFLIETNNIIDKKVYSLSYFKFPDDFNKYIKNKKEIFNKNELTENLTYVETLNSRNFEEKVINDHSFNEFMIEIKHEGCPTCYMLGKMFDHVSQKFNKHNLLNKFKFFRVDTHNDLKHLGEFAATPTYLFCRKSQDGKIELISQIEKNEFVFKMRKLSNLDMQKIRYHPNIGFGFYLFQRQEFIKENYDPDLDLNGFKI